MVVHFVCQLDICQDIWLAMIMGVSVRVQSDEISIWIDRLGKADCPPQLEGNSSNQLKI